jgi:hypothetical protein
MSHMPLLNLFDSHGTKVNYGELKPAKEHLLNFIGTEESREPRSSLKIPL